VARASSASWPTLLSAGVSPAPKQRIAAQSANIAELVIVHLHAANLEEWVLEQLPRSVSLFGCHFILAQIPPFAPLGIGA
jgi:hypothetical protein